MQVRINTKSDRLSGKFADTIIIDNAIWESARTKIRERCANCPAIVEGNCGEWVCDEKHARCENVHICPEGLDNERE